MVLDHYYRRNIKLVYGLKFFGMFLVLMPVIVPFFLGVGMSMKDIYLLMSIFSITLFAFEVPSGYFADLFGRKVSLLCSTFLRGVGFSIFPFATGMSDLIIAEITLGISLSLFSGTDISLMYDSLEALGEKEKQKKTLGRAVGLFSTGEALASVLATLLLFTSFVERDLAFVSAGLSWISFFIACGIVEPKREKLNKKAHKENFKYIYRKLFKESLILRLTLVNMILLFLSTLLAVWVFQKYWIEIDIPIKYFGLLWALINFTVSFFAFNADRLEKKLGTSLTVILIALTPCLGFLGISIVDSFLGVIACLLFQFSRGVGQVVFKNALNERVSSDFRATANSISGLGVRSLFIFLGPIYGALIDNFGVQQASLYLGLCFIAVFLFVSLPFALKIKKGYFGKL